MTFLGLGGDEGIGEDGGGETSGDSSQAGVRDPPKRERETWILISAG